MVVKMLDGIRHHNLRYTYYVIKNEDLCGKLKNDGSMIDYVYGPEPSKFDDVICEQPLTANDANFHF